MIRSLSDSGVSSSGGCTTITRMMIGWGSVAIESAPGAYKKWRRSAQRGESLESVGDYFWRSLQRTAPRSGGQEGAGCRAPAGSGTICSGANRADPLVGDRSRGGCAAGRAVCKVERERSRRSDQILEIVEAALGGDRGCRRRPLPCYLNIRGVP
ncbi:hypothetical protein QR680_011346 [Steinernema hermaphroditum]|uniref:Uncharacterized protein n=1 Tax=Steinernema hermaphroditum TaxID=289476 RepID=A0AA39ITD6_9BILA|nr:hypothetical protein QR680_011346 [Steinernema hermaphroditum]